MIGGKVQEIWDFSESTLLKLYLKWRKITENISPHEVLKHEKYLFYGALLALLTTFFITKNQKEKERL